MYPFLAPQSNTILINSQGDRLISFESQNVEKIRINNQDYTLIANDQDLQPGQFKELDGTIFVSLLDNTPKNFALDYIQNSNNIYESVLPSLPRFIANSGNVEADIVVSRSFGGYANTAIVIEDCLANKTYYDALKNGLLVNLFNILFRISSIEINDFIQDGEDRIKVALSLDGKHAPYGASGAPENPLDYKIRLSDYGTCNNYVAEISIRSFCAKVGLIYKGKNFVVKVPSNPGDTTVTCRELIENRAAYVGGYPYWSGQNVEIRTWRSRNHILPMSSKIVKSALQKKGQGATISGKQLTQAYRNAEIVLDDDKDSEDTTEDYELRREWKFTNCSGFADLQSPAIPEGLAEDGYAGYRIPSIDIAKNPGNAFDVNGLTKAATEEFYLGDILVFSRTFVWGYVFSSLDTHRVFRQTLEAREEFTGTHFYRFVPSSVRNITKYWRQVSFYTTDQVFDDIGYLIAEVTNGKKLGRLLKDDNSLKAIKALEQYYEYNLASDRAEDVEQRQEAERLAAAYYQLAQAYRFNRVFPETKVVRYILHPHERYYKDIKPPTTDDCFAIPLKFYKVKRTESRDILIEDNPLSTDDLPQPPIITGHETISETVIDILSTKGRGKYKTTTIYIDRRDEGLRQTIKYEPGSISSGRPTTQIRLKKRPPNSAPKPKSNRNDNKKFIINTVGVKDLPHNSLDLPIIEQTISYQDIDNLSQAIAIAQLKSAIANTLNAETFTRDSYHLPFIDEGDIVWDNGKPFLVKEIKTIFSKHQQEYCIDQSLTLACLLEPQVTVKTIFLKSKKGSSQSRNKAIDGRISKTNNIYNLLDPDTARRANELGLLEDFAEKQGYKVYGANEFEDPEVDLIDQYQKDIGAIPENADTNQDDSDGIKLTEREPKTPLDLREKSDEEEFTDLINRISLLEEFKKLSAEKIQDLINENEENEGGSGGGGGGDGGLGSGFIVDFEEPQLILEGGDNFLSDLLNQLLGNIQGILDLLSGQQEDSGAGGGGSGGGGGGAGGGAGSGGGGGEIPVFQTGERTIYVDQLDVEGILLAILEGLLAAIALAENFSFTLPELAELFAENAASGSGGGTGGGGGSAGGGGGGGGDVTVVLQPEGVEPATIRHIFPPNLSLDDLDLTAIFEALDYLLQLLDNIANETFDFDLDLSLLEPQAGLANEITGAPSVSKSASSDEQSGGASGVGQSGNVTYVVAEVEDITGVIGGGLSGNTNYPSSFQGEGGGSGGGGGGQTGSETGGQTGSETGSVTGEDYNFGSSSPNSSGNPNEFTAESGNLNNEIADFTPQPVEISPNTTPTEFVYPISAANLGSVTDTPLLDVGDDFTILLSGGTQQIRLSDIVANDFIFWKILNNTPGVSILTPHDINPTIEFSNTYVSDSITVEACLVNHNLCQTLKIQTSTIDSLSLSNFAATSKPVNLQFLAVDISTVRVTNADPNATITVQSGNIQTITWLEPHGTVQGYYIETYDNYSWQKSALLTDAIATIDVTKQNRIIAVYDSFEIPSDNLDLESGSFIFAQESANLVNFATTGKLNLASLTYTENPIFNTIESTEQIAENASLNDFAYGGTASLTVSYTEENIFNAINTSENISDTATLNGFYIAGSAGLTLNYTEEIVFSSS